MGADRLQKHSSRFSLQLMQLSTISNPYGVFISPPDELEPETTDPSPLHALDFDAY
jgi:hypothetical protein